MSMSQGSAISYSSDVVIMTQDNMTSVLDVNVTTSQLSHVTQEDAMSHTWLRVLFISLYVLVFVLGMGGNCLVVYIVVRDKALQTITNIFIANLAASDIMKCLLAVPFTPISGLLQSWTFGDVLCHVIPMSLGVSVHVSTLTSTAIAIDRYFVIVHPFKPRMTVAMCMLLIGAIWLVSLSISLPLAIFQQVSWDDQESVYACEEHWPRPAVRQFFTVISLILQYIVPCSIITFCYARVSSMLRKRSSRRMRGSASRSRDELEINRKRKTNNMLIAMVSIFVCCWLPLNVLHLILEYYEAANSWTYFTLVFFIAHLIAMSSIVYNPFLYAWMNENFRKEFKQVLPCLFYCRKTSTASNGGGMASSKRGPMKTRAGIGGRYTTVDTETHADIHNNKITTAIKTTTTTTTITTTTTAAAAAATTTRPGPTQKTEATKNRLSTTIASTTGTTTTTSAATAMATAATATQPSAITTAATTPTKPSTRTRRRASSTTTATTAAATRACTTLAKSTSNGEFPHSISSSRAKELIWLDEQTTNNYSEDIKLFPTNHSDPVGTNPTNQNEPLDINLLSSPASQMQ